MSRDTHKYLAELVFLVMVGVVAGVAALTLLIPAI